MNKITAELLIIMSASCGLVCANFYAGIVGLLAVFGTAATFYKAQTPSNNALKRFSNKRIQALEPRYGMDALLAALYLPNKNDPR